MLAYLAGIVGLGLGIFTARKRGGNRADMAQYGFGFAVAFFLLTYLALVIVNRIL